MIYEILLALTTMQPASDTEWPIGGWNTKHCGAIRLLDDGYVIDLDPEGKLQNWGIWQYYCGENAVLIIWMESSYDDVIQKNNDKYFIQSLWSGDMSSKVEEVKKIGK